MSEMTERGGSIRRRPWRVGRSLGRTIYAQNGDEPSKDDIFLGIMDTVGLAAYVVRLHNLDCHETR